MIIETPYKLGIFLIFIYLFWDLSGQHHSILQGLDPRGELWAAWECLTPWSYSDLGAVEITWLQAATYAHRAGRCGRMGALSYEYLFKSCSRTWLWNFYGCVPGTLYTLQKVLLFSFVWYLLSCLVSYRELRGPVPTVYTIPFCSIHCRLLSCWVSYPWPFHAHRTQVRSRSFNTYNCMTNLEPCDVWIGSGPIAIQKLHA